VTDLEKLKALLTEFGVGFETRRSVQTCGGIVVECREGATKVAGNPYFFTAFDFDAQGKFIEMGAYE